MKSSPLITTLSILSLVPLLYCYAVHITPTAVFILAAILTLAAHSVVEAIRER